MASNNTKILFLINSLDSGGAERVLSKIVPEMSSNYDVSIITLKTGNFYSDDVKSASLSRTKSNAIMFLLFPYYIKKVHTLSKNAKIVSFLEYSNFINILANKNAIISFRTSIGFFTGIKGRIYKCMIKYLYPKAKAIIVNSEENKESLKKYLSISEEKIKVIYNPVNRKEIVHKNAQIQKRKGQEIKLLTVGRLDKMKNVASTIRGFASICSNNNLSLTIIGDGPQRKKLESLCRELNVQDKVKFLGTQKNISEHMQKHDYFIFSSLSEGFPNVLVEAAAAGLPIISSDFRTGAREILSPGMSFEKKLDYPCFCPNGVLLSEKNFEADLVRAWKNRKKIQQNQEGLERFYIKSILPLYKRMLK